jgi:hypothetical protein
VTPGADIQKPGLFEEITDDIQQKVDDEATNINDEEPKIDEYKSGPELDQRDYETDCYLDTWYQLLAVLYMLLIYCQLVLFAIFLCTTLSYMTRFFHHVDDVPQARQRRMPVAEGGRGHALLRRTMLEYKAAFDYGCFMMSRGGFGRQAEIRYIANYRTNQRNANQRKMLKHLIYKTPKKKADGSMSPESKVFDKHEDCTICIEPFKKD